MAITELRPHLYRLVLGRYQAYLWYDGRSSALIDSGEVGCAAVLARDLAVVGLAPHALDRLVLTHFHDDHAGSAAGVAAWGPVEVVAHAADAPVLRGERPGRPPCFTADERALHAVVADGLLAAPPVRVDREVRDGDVLDFAGGAVVVATPGHTEGSIALHLPAARAVITGDIAAEHQGEVMLGVFHQEQADAVASLRRLAELDVDVACFGHSEPALRGAGSLLRAAAARAVSRAVPAPAGL